MIIKTAPDTLCENISLAIMFTFAKQIGMIVFDKHGVLRRSKKLGVPVWLLSGSIEDTSGILTKSFDFIRSINDGDNRPISVLLHADVAKENLTKTMKNLIIKRQ